MAKSQKVIFAHSLVNIMGAIGDRALAPMFLHPLQYGGRNLGKAYCAEHEYMNMSLPLFYLSGWLRNWDLWPPYR